jgi:hypothetical protein
VYTPCNLQACIEHPMIDTVWINDVTTFKDWDAQQDGFITWLTDFNTRHVFLVSATRNNGITMYMESYSGCGDVVARNLVKPVAMMQANFWLNLLDPPPVDPVDILDIKWMELYNKWKKFVPEESKAKWRYYSEYPRTREARQGQEEPKEDKGDKKSTHNGCRRGTKEA